MLPELFKSEDRVRILRYVAERKNVTVQTTAQGTGVSKPVVSRYLNLLIEKGLCERSGRENSMGAIPYRVSNQTIPEHHTNR